MLSYRHRSGGGEWQDEFYAVRLDWTHCTYGGQRAWFLCPGAGCGRRVAILYFDGLFTCRQCCRIAYSCQRESTIDRAARRADTIRQRLGWPTGLFNPKGGKPKGMRWRTYERLTTQHEAFAGVALAGLARRLGLVPEQPG